MTRRASPGHSPTAAAVDPSGLSTYVGSDLSLQLRFLRAFVNETQRSVERIATSLAQRDLAQARAEAHKLKPSAIVVGAQRLVQLCIAIELSLPETDYLPILASQLRSERLLVEEGIEQFVARLSSRPSAAS
jgi:HPt (histidine-containing phosphotransfer) domain-containing protein